MIAWLTFASFQILHSKSNISQLHINLYVHTITGIVNSTGDCMNKAVNWRTPQLKLN